MIRSGEGQNPPVAEGSGQDTPGPKSLESSRGGRSRSRSGSSSGKRDRDRGRDRSRSRTPGSGRSRRARGQLKTEADQRISVDRSARETPSPRRVGGAGPAPPPSTGCGSGGARPPRGPSRYGRLDESSTGSAEGGRMRNGEGAARRPQRQAGRIDYWIEPNSSVAPDRPRRAAAARRRWPSAHRPSHPHVPSSLTPASTQRASLAVLRTPSVGWCYRGVAAADPRGSLGRCVCAGQHGRCGLGRPDLRLGCAGTLRVPLRVWTAEEWHACNASS
jgi:hypothetical protein